LKVNKAIVLPESWTEQAEFFIARLNKFQPCFFTIPTPSSAFLDSDHFLTNLYLLLDHFEAKSSLIVLPKSWAKVEKMKDWPALVCNEKNHPVVNSIFFADEWQEVEIMLKEFLDEKIDLNPKTHLTCQYQPPYTTMLKLWADAGAEEYHPGDYFKSEILVAISKMTGNWVYWGHGEGNLLRGYGHLKKSELLLHIPEKPLNATIWFTCSTLDNNVNDNIALSWYLNGATKCLLASPYNVKTEANKMLSEAWLTIAKSRKKNSIASIILKLLDEDSIELKESLANYYLLGNPWVIAGV
jgi:hypothetical protein